MKTFEPRISTFLMTTIYWIK